ncbi:putative lipid II flippase FtsW [Carboxydochorda subterranea]|uniref:Probable peptidoglycan glycosyltransferase FtsW n=1 Tax=Carboxydichorda subterranea TaxID=3109565 RepID=A0ABZ1C1E9_9FIRM|nr:putative lipid II flippase FtsW [Limnochorda sp. L945t]WRP18616.1 putative lipid II flippase FtsW [Limnochorda sp. L945t]
MSVIELRRRPGSPPGEMAASDVPHAQAPPDLVLIAALSVLMAIGLVMVLSASYTRGLAQFRDPYYFFKRQVVYAAMSWALALAMLRFDVQRLRPVAVPLMVFSYVLLAVVLVVGQEIGGSRRWISLPFVNLQPSELAKLAAINFTAWWAADRTGTMSSFVRGPLVPLLAVGVAFGLIMLEPDFGTGLVLLAVVVAVLFAGGMRYQQLVVLGLLALPAMLALIWIEPYRMARLLAFLDPWADPAGKGWSVIQSLLAVGSGGLFGLGLGQSRQKFAYLPEHHTDFIFAILSEELGWIGAATVVALFAVVAWRGYRIALGLQDRYEQLLAVGAVSLVVVQGLLNIGVVTGSLPVTGIPLPFISYGGSSLMASMTAMGVLLRLSRRSVL